MECVPVLRLLVEQTADRVLPLPLRAIVAQPEIETPPSVKLTLPVGLKPVTEAVKVRFAPIIEGLAELDNTVLLVAVLTTCDNALLVDVLYVGTPPDCTPVPFEPP